MSDDLMSDLTESIEIVNDRERRKAKRIPRKENVESITVVIARSPKTIPEIVKITGLSQPTIQDIINMLRADGKAYLAMWKHTKAGRVYRYVACYRRGSGPDAPKPARQTVEEKRARNRAHCAKLRQAAKAKEPTKPQKAEAERHERLRKELARPAFRDPLVAAFYGEYRGAAA
jgi:DNA-binding Lrp family transcriptional regulator